MLQKIQLKHQRRREANANERKRIKELNEAIKRLKETTNQSSGRLQQIIQQKNEEKSQSKKKLTKLAIIKSAIQHIKLMQQTLEQSNVGSHSGHSQDAVECIQSLPSIITFPTISPKENFVDSDRFAEDDKLIFKTGGFHSIEVKTEEEIEMFNESEEDNEEEYVIVEDAEKYQIIPVEQDYKVFSNVIYFDGP